MGKPYVDLPELSLPSGTLLDPGLYEAELARLQFLRLRARDSASAADDSSDEEADREPVRPAEPGEEDDSEFESREISEPSSDSDEDDDADRWANSDDDDEYDDLQDVRPPSPSLPGWIHFSRPRPRACGGRGLSTAGPRAAEEERAVCLC
jgi:hypothetical protein